MIFNFPFRVYYEDTDAGGVLYHANYLKFMERARTEMLFSLKIPEFPSDSLFFVVYRAELDYLRPARLYDELQVVSRVAQIKSAALVFEQIICAAADRDKIFCKGLITLVQVDRNLQPRRIDNNLISRLTNAN